MNEGAGSSSSLPSLSTMLLHTIALTSHFHTLYSLFTYPMPIDITFAWHFQYLTTLGLSVSTLVFLFAASVDLWSFVAAEEDGNLRRLRSAKGALSCVAAPGEILITSLYFGLQAISTDLVVPQWARLPLLLDLNLHLTPTLFQLVDFIYFSPRWTISGWQALGLGVTLAGLYWVWTEKCREMNGFYAYPIFEGSGFLGRIGLFGMSALLIACNTVILNWLQGFVRNAQKSQVKE